MGVVAVVLLTILLVVVIIVVLVVRRKKRANSKTDAYDRVLHHYEQGEDNNYNEFLYYTIGGNTLGGEEEDGSTVDGNRGPTYDDVNESIKEPRYSFVIHPQQHVGTATHTTTQPGGKTTGLGPISVEYDDLDSKTHPQQYDFIVTYTTTPPGGTHTDLGPISAEYDDVDHKTHPQQYDDIVTYAATQPGGTHTKLGPISAEYDDVDHKTDSQYDFVLSHTITQPGGKTDGLMPISAGYEDLDSVYTNTTATKTEQRRKRSYTGEVLYTVPDKLKNTKGENGDSCEDSEESMGHTGVPT